MTEASPPRGARVPELGPWLGSLVVGTDSISGLRLEEIRLRLVERLFAAGHRVREGGTGVARSSAAVLREEWLEAFRAAADEAAHRCLAEIDRRLEEAVRVSRMPAALFARHRPSDEDRRVTVNRFESAAIPLEQVLHRGDEAGVGGLRRDATLVEASWDRLVRVAAEELAAGDREAAVIRAWVRPRAPLWVLTAIVALVALLLGLVLGGYLPAPGLLGSLRRGWWGLPWP